jgi:hypothetical protein
MKIGDIDKLKDAETKDGTLDRVRELVKDGRRKTTRGGQEYQYIVKKGVLYRIFTKKTGAAEVETRKIVNTTGVPEVRHGVGA